MKSHDNHCYERLQCEIINILSQGGNEEYFLKRDVYTRPSAVQMCFVEVRHY